MFMLPLWNKYKNYTTDIWDSLGIFLEGYAFERQGRSPDYSYAAVDSLLYCKQRYKGKLYQTVVNDIWEQFRKLLNYKGLNTDNNCLYSDNCLYLIQKKSALQSVIEMVLNNGITQQKYTLVTYLINSINQNNDIKPAFELLTSIRGIGNKIASFYLRDLVDVMNVNLGQIQNRDLLQPIDIWVERIIKTLSNNQNMDKKEMPNWIVDQTPKNQNNVNPERINMGIWFFCSNIIKSKYRLNTALGNPNDAQNLLNDFKNNIRNICQYC
jgi:endonuclease III